MGKENDARLFKIELNDMGDYIDISIGDTELFDRFRETYKQIAEAAKDLPRRYQDIDKVRAIPGHENKTVEKIRIKVRFCMESAEEIDSIFGQGTLKKYFRSLYAEIPDFMLGTECFIDFYDQMAPVLEGLFGCRVDDSEKECIRKRLILIIGLCLIHTTKFAHRFLNLQSYLTSENRQSRRDLIRGIQWRTLSDCLSWQRAAVF